VKRYPFVPPRPVVRFGATRQTAINTAGGGRQDQAKWSLVFWTFGKTVRSQDRGTQQVFFKTVAEAERA
jgi:hypothetical protein